jgi:hypothetical protein
MSMVDRSLLIRRAIHERRLIEFHFDGLLRIGEPHDYGIHAGVERLLVYQTAGESRSGQLPNWREIHVARIENLRVLGETFPGPRVVPSGRHKKWDTLLASVSRNV